MAASKLKQAYQIDKVTGVSEAYLTQFFLVLHATPVQYRLCKESQLRHRIVLDQIVSWGLLQWCRK